MEIILGSSSARRIKCFKNLNLPYTILKPDTDETLNPKLSGRKQVEVLSMEKMEYLQKHFYEKIKTKWVLTADTLVYYKKKKFGKPKDLNNAREMLTYLSGKTHRVSTAITIKTPTEQLENYSDTTMVRFCHLPPIQIENYLALNEWKGAAGAYRIQETGDMLIKSINGSFSNVMGLPLSLLYDILFCKGFFDKSNIPAI